MVRVEDDARLEDFELCPDGGEMDPGGCAESFEHQDGEDDDENGESLEHMMVEYVEELCRNIKAKFEEHDLATLRHSTKTADSEVECAKVVGEFTTTTSVPSRALAQSVSASPLPSVLTTDGNGDQLTTEPLAFVAEGQGEMAYSDGIGSSARSAKSAADWLTMTF